jgi:hypothetical protein
MQVDLHHLQIIALAELTRQFHHLWGLEFDDFSTLHTGEVIMRPVTLDSLEMTVVFAKLVFIHQADLFQKCQGAVDGGDTDPFVAFPGAFENGLSVQVFRTFFQNLQNELPLAGKPAALAANGIE